MRMDGPGRVVGVRPQNLIVVLGLSDVLQVSGLFAAEVLSRLDPTDLALLRRVDRAFRAAVESSSHLPRAGVSEEVPHKLRRFVGSVNLLAWAMENGCPRSLVVVNSISHAAEGGHLEVAHWARERGWQWDARTCGQAAMGGHLEVLKWARRHGCPWDEMTCVLRRCGRAPGCVAVGAGEREPCSSSSCRGCRSC